MPPGKEVWLVTGDVVAMYPNIPIEDGIQQIATMLNVSPMYFETLEEAANLPVKSLDELTVLLLWLVLQYNYASFAGHTFCQVFGTAMGTATAPTYANLFLAGYEAAPLKQLTDIILYYGRFIDDISAIIVGSQEDVLKFQDRFGKLHPNMKMEWTHSRHQIPFLDVHVSLEVAPGRLRQSSKVEVVTHVYQKALNAYLYIPWNSCHSDASKRSWVRGPCISIPMENVRRCRIDFMFGNSTCLSSKFHHRCCLLSFCLFGTLSKVLYHNSNTNILTKHVKLAI
jgi:hypothetical protein